MAPVGDARHAWAALLLPRGAVNSNSDVEAVARLFGELGLSDALGGLAAIVPIAAAALLGDDSQAKLPAEKIILLLTLADCTDPAQEEALGRLVRKGFRLMADGVPAEGTSLLASVGAVANDAGVGAEAGADLAAVKHLAPAHLATGVDDQASFERCRHAGYRWFAGDYPLTLRAPRSQPPGSPRTLLLRLLAMVTSDADSRDIETLLKQDPALSYHLLKLVNSVSFALTTTITSFSYAITLLGRRQLQRWLQLLLYAQQRRGDDASPLLARAARRAAFMEALSVATGGNKEEQDHAFMTGMFSLLDALFCMPLDKIVTPLHLSGDVEEGLLAHGGRLGRLLSLVERSEQPPTATLSDELKAIPLSPVAYARALVSACAWAIQVSRDT